MFQLMWVAARLARPGRVRPVPFMPRCRRTAHIGTVASACTMGAVRLAPRKGPDRIAGAPNAMPRGVTVASTLVPAPEIDCVLATIARAWITAGSREATVRVDRATVAPAGI